jgi:hypothetical protein
MNKLEVLQEITFGERVAEEETDVLRTYFVETDQWRRLYRGDIDVVYGPKGAGKSALYSLLLSKNSELFDRYVLLIAGENPRGTTAFQDLVIDPPASEREFVGLWKLYLTVLLHGALVEYDVRNAAATELGVALAREGLVKGKSSLSAILAGVIKYAQSWFRPVRSVEGGISLTGVNGKITFTEPTPDAQDSELRSVDTLLKLANSALNQSGYKAWVLLDRLDVAFSDHSELESNALRALFRVYLDIGGLNSVHLKIFLRTDIWSRITQGGFPEASHITKHVTLEWSKNALLNLVVRRALHNKAFREAFGVAEELGRTDLAEQEALFYRMCPRQIDLGSNKPTTFDWVLSRTRDGSKANAPRELIHLFNSLREVEVSRLEIGGEPAEADQLFARPSFKDALPAVSKVRLEQTVYAEYPSQRPWIEKLRGVKTSQWADSLAGLWGISEDDAATQAKELVSIGFFEERGSRDNPEYWVPFLYRDALDLVQGSAD